jgi:hypothetical protein
LDLSFLKSRHDPCTVITGGLSTVLRFKVWMIWVVFDI